MMIWGFDGAIAWSAGGYQIRRSPRVRPLGSGLPSTLLPTGVPIGVSTAAARAWAADHETWLH